MPAESAPSLASSPKPYAVPQLPAEEWLSMLKHVPVAVAIFDSSGMCTWRNKKAWEFFPDDRSGLEHFVDSKESLLGAVAEGKSYRFKKFAPGHKLLTGQAVCGADPFSKQHVLLCSYTDNTPMEGEAAARDSQTQDQLRTLQRKLLGLVAENDALKAVTYTMMDELQTASGMLEAAGTPLTSTFLSDEAAKSVLECLLHGGDDHNVDDLDSFAMEALPEEPGLEEPIPVAVGEDDNQLLQLIQLKRAAMAHKQGNSKSLDSRRVPSLGSSGSSSGTNMVALKSKLKSLLAERDQARVQVAAIKAARDQLVVRSTAEKEHMGALQVQMKSMYDHLAEESAHLKAGYDSLASANAELLDCAAQQKGAFDLQQAQLDKIQEDAAVQKAAHDFQAAQIQQLHGDAVGHKASFDLQKAQYDELQVAATAQKAAYDKLHEDATELKSGYDAIASNNAELKQMYDAQKSDYDQLEQDAAEQKSSFDLQKANYDQLQADAAVQKAAYDKLHDDASQLKSGYDAIASNNAELKQMYDSQKADFDQLEQDAAEQKSSFDLQKANYDQLQVDAAEHKATFDVQKAAYDKLQVDATQLKSGYDLLASDAKHLKNMYDAQKADFDELQDNNTLLKVGYDAIADDATELKQRYDAQKADFDQLQVDAAEQQAFCDKLQEDAAEMKLGFDSIEERYMAQKNDFDQLAVDAAQMKSEFDTQQLNYDKLVNDSTVAKSHYDQVEEVAAAQQALIQQLQNESVALSAEKAKLQENNAALQAEQEQLMRKQEVLQAELQFQAMRKKSSIIDSGTPADKILHVMTELLDGSIPNITDILYIQSAILESHNIYKPLNVKQQIMQSDKLEDDVSRLLVAQLGDDSVGPALAVDSISLEDLCNRRKRVTGSRSSFDIPAGAERFSSVASAVSWITTATTWEGIDERTKAAIAATKAIAALRQSPARPLFTEVEDALATCNNWEFDAFRLADITNGNPLSTLGFYLFHEHDLISKFSLDPAALARFLMAVEAGYRRNPYHNATHAADVLQTLHMLLHQGGLVPGYADHLTIMAAYTAAIVHDYEHGGLTNDYLINAQHDLSITYNDRAPLENHHAASAFRLLRRPDLNFMTGLSKADATRFRKLVIDLVLATDMKQHFSILSHFVTIHRLTAPGMSSPSSRSADGNHRRQSSSLSFLAENPDREKIILPLDENERLLSLQVALKCSDIGHLAASQEVHKRWVQGLEEEFFLQGDNEKANNLPVSALFDRDKPGVTKSQVGFFDIVAVPLFLNFTRIFTNAKPLLNNVLRNYNYWVTMQLDSATAATAAGAAAAVATKAAVKAGH